MNNPVEDNLGLETTKKRRACYSYSVRFSVNGGAVVDLDTPHDQLFTKYESYV